MDEDTESKYDPTKVADMMIFIKNERMQALEGKISDRQIKIINANADG